jgi:hypothetical protein
MWMKIDYEWYLYEDLFKKSCDEFQSIIQPKILNKTTDNSACNWPDYTVLLSPPKFRVMTVSYKQWVEKDME